MNEPLQFFLNYLNEANLWHKKQVLERNEFLKIAGTTDPWLYHVLSGSFRVFMNTEGEEQTIRFGYTNSILAAIDSFITGQPSDFAIQALKRSEVHQIHRDSLMPLVDKKPELQRVWIAINEQFVCQQLERERDLLTFSPAVRYQRVLQRSPQLFQEIPHKYIAAYLRMTPETLSRLKKS